MATFRLFDRNQNREAVQSPKSDRSRRRPRRGLSWHGIERLEGRELLTTWNFSTVATFNGLNGAYPNSGLTIDSQNNLIGTTYNGGPGWVTNNYNGAGGGTIFEVAAGTNTITTLGSFATNGFGNPEGSVVSDATTGHSFDTGNIYGVTNSSSVTTPYGNCGSYFKIVPGSGTAAPLAQFNLYNQERYPTAGVASYTAANGVTTLYGTTISGGANADGNVWSIVEGTNTITNLASFSKLVNGQAPQGGEITVDPAGDIFGTTRNGGPGIPGNPNPGSGTVWEITPDMPHTIKVLASFAGYRPNGSTLLRDPATGNLYGTTLDTAGGTGTLFKLVKGAGETYTFTTLWNFTPWSGGSPGSGTYGPGPNAPQGDLAIDNNGNIYGTTTGGGITYNSGGGANYYGGTVYEYVAATHSISTLYSLPVNPNVPSQGQVPTGVVMDSHGNLFGAFHENNLSITPGSIFELSPVNGPSVKLPAGTPTPAYAHQGTPTATVDQAISDIAANSNSSKPSKTTASTPLASTLVKGTLLNGVATVRLTNVPVASTPIYPGDTNFFGRKKGLPAFD